MILLGSLNIVKGPVILMTDIDDKLKAGAKAVANKADNAYRDLKTDYQKEKYETEGHVENKSEIGRDLERVGDKLEAGARAVVNKTDDAYRDLKTEYQKEKIKEKLD
jgi:ribosomal protein S21